jgi:uncharacterized membrane protein
MTLPRSALIVGGLVLLVLILQLVPTAAADNPPVEEEVTAPEEVMTLLRRSCYDCHSHETVWQWYAHVAPAKWLVRKDVAEGRENLKEEVAEEVGEGEMPLKFYLPLHGEARLTDRERSVIVEWAQSQAEGED